MMILVIVIHCNVIHMPGYDGSKCVTECINFFISKIAVVAVPWFFFISAYLMGYLHNEIDFSSYKSTIKRRIKSLLLPFILWNTIAFLIREGVNISPLHKFTSGGHNFNSIGDFLFSIYILPELEPLWFLRNLFLLSILYPIFKKIVQFNSIFALIIFWIIEQYTFASGTLYFGLGFIAAKYFNTEKINHLLPKFAKLLPIVLILMYVSYRYFNNLDILNDLLIILGMLSIWGTSCLLTNSTREIERPDIIFFIYASHGLISHYVLKSLNVLFNFTGYYWLILYIMSIVLVIAICFGSAIILKYLSPDFYAILTGVRNKKLSAL